MTNLPHRIKVIGTRPTETPNGTPIPETTLIFNAPRPLYGNPVWQGDFQHGIFYAVVDFPNGEYSQEQYRDNVSLDGWLIEYASKDEAFSWAVSYYERNFPEVLESLCDSDHYLSNLLKCYLRQHNMTSWHNGNDAPAALDEKAHR